MNDFTSTRRGFTRWQIALALAVLGIIAAALLPVFFTRTHYEPSRSSCQSNLKQIMLGVRQYIQDYDEKYPPIALNARVASYPDGGVSAFGWADSLYPYLKSTQIFQCTPEKTPPNSDPTKSGYTDYWFNARMAGVSEQSLSEISSTVALGDGNSDNARYHLWGIPRNWMGNKKSPLYRHLGGANYAFADGHVKWFRTAPERWANGLDLDSSSGATLRLKPIN